MNNDTIKFTSKWSTEEIGFLDVRVVKEFGRLATDLFVNATKSHQYLLVIQGRVIQAYLFPERCCCGEFVRGNETLKRGPRISLLSW